MMKASVLALVGVGAACVVGALLFACGTDNGNGGTGCTGDACDGGPTQDATTGQDGASQADGSAFDATVTDGATLDGGAGDGGDAAVVCNGGGAGTLDPSFGDGGVVWLMYPGAQAASVLVQPDGKIVVGGNTSPQNFALVRLLPNGSLDTTFGANGLVETHVGKYTNTFNSLALQADGKIVGVGEADLNGGKSYDFTVVRYHADGGLDLGFGDGGISINDIGGGEDFAQSVIVQPDGRILVTGFATAASGIFSTTNYALARYTADGSLDATFGTGGKVTIDLHGTADSPGAATLTPGGEALIAGASGQTTSLTTNSDVSAAAVLADGGLDMAFGDGGKFIWPSGSGSAQASSVSSASGGGVVLTLRDPLVLERETALFLSMG